MTQAFKKCKSCHTIMPVSAKECEHCRFAAQKNWGTVFLACTLIGLIMLFAFVILKNF